MLAQGTFFLKKRHVSNVSVFFQMDLDNSTTTEEDYNESIYFLEPHADPKLTQCFGVSLKSELMVSLLQYITRG